jgi:hypothetical protein
MKFSGCKAVLFLKDHQTHYEKCDYVAVKCPLKDCPARVLRGDFPKHIKDKHTPIVVKKKDDPPPDIPNFFHILIWYLIFLVVSFLFTLIFDGDTRA